MVVVIYVGCVDEDVVVVVVYVGWVYVGIFECFLCEFE